MVLSNNDGCVVSRSQEVKDLGIKMGVPWFQLKEHTENYNAMIELMSDEDKTAARGAIRLLLKGDTHKISCLASNLVEANLPLNAQIHISD